MTKPGQRRVTMADVDRLYARCQSRGGCQYGSQRIWRDYNGHRLEVRICARCGVPERPKPISKISKRPRSELGSYWD